MRLQDAVAWSTNLGRVGLWWARFYRSLLCPLHAPDSIDHHKWLITSCRCVAGTKCGGDHPVGAAHQGFRVVVLPVLLHCACFLCSILTSSYCPAYTSLTEPWERGGWPMLGCAHDMGNQKGVCNASPSLYWRPHLMLHCPQPLSPTQWA